MAFKGSFQMFLIGAMILTLAETIYTLFSFEKKCVMIINKNNSKVLTAPQHITATLIAQYNSENIESQKFYLIKIENKAKKNVYSFLSRYNNHFLSWKDDSSDVSFSTNPRTENAQWRLYENSDKTVLIQSKEYHHCLNVENVNSTTVRMDTCLDEGSALTRIRDRFNFRSRNGERNVNLQLALTLKDAEKVSVVTSKGEIIGQRITLPSINNSTLTVKTFLSIPYAEPPIGDQRFRAPIEVAPWDQALPALEQPKSCVQRTHPALWDTVSEDCLYLNVWVPERSVADPSNSITDSDDNDKFAVMVYIFGGGFMQGSIRSYDFSVLSALQDVIVVAMNYRLGPLGFLYLESEDCPGNMGLKDQDMALNWVKDNIEQFGGDPDSITIFGHSAGSMSVGYHLLNPNSQHLFNRAILQSGSPYMRYVTDSPFKAKMKSQIISKNVGCQHDPDDPQYVIECLKNSTVEELLFATFKSEMQPFPFEDNLNVFQDRFTPNLSGNKSVLMGVTSDDGGFLVVKATRPNTTMEELLQYFSFIFANGKMDSHIVELIKFYYKDRCTEFTDYATERASVRLFTDFVFLCSTNHLADTLATLNIPTYMYQFKHKPKSSHKPDWIDADHADELPFLLGGVFEHGDADETELATRLMSYWGNFAKFGDPNFKTDLEDDSLLANETVVYLPDGAASLVPLEQWPLYTTETRGRLDIDLLESRRAFGPLREDHCAFWQHIYPKIIKN